jgi:enoyl-[acyl-carrier-protein] reductase (NADH)
MMGLFSGKTGLVMGVANDRSIAWAMSEAVFREGAELAYAHLPGPSSQRRVSRLVEFEELGTAGLYLLSDFSNGVTGETIHVDCGYSIVGL